MTIKKQLYDKEGNEVMPVTHIDCIAGIWKGTKEEYDAIESKDSKTLYFIVESATAITLDLPAGDNFVMGVPTTETEVTDTAVINKEETDD